MVVFPNAKINIGLNILRQRSDGYHDLETIFYPIGLKDALEFVENNTNEVNLTCSGISMDVEPEKNIVLKAYRLLSSSVTLPGLDIHLHKAIPYGAGLGGGSSDAAFLLKSLNEHFELKLSKEKLKSNALVLGADCSFFIENKPALATGIGEILKSIEVNLKGYTILLIKPPFGVVTKDAYAKIEPAVPQHSLNDSVREKPENWMGKINNDFEEPVFHLYPEISNIKKALLDKGAIYASMSGSGSSVFGLFKTEPDIELNDIGEGCFVWKELL